MKKRIAVVMLALLSMLAMVSYSAPAPAQADNGYIDCMNHAITHKYALIDAGWSYSAAHAHYLEHTTGCYNYFYGGGAY